MAVHRCEVNMSNRKKEKVQKLSDEEYNAYLLSLKEKEEQRKR